MLMNIFRSHKGSLSAIKGGKMKRITLSLYTLVVLLIFARPAYAYLDPGSTSMLLQVLLGGLAAVAVVLKLFWRRILTFLGIYKKKEE